MEQGGGERDDEINTVGIEREGTPINVKCP